MGRNGVHLVREWSDEPEIRAWLTSPREDLVQETVQETVHETVLESHDTVIARFTQSHGPFVSYERTVTQAVPEIPGYQESGVPGGTLRDHVSYTVTIPWFRWLFAPLIRRHLRSRRPGHELALPRWSPPDRLDAPQAQLLGLLAAASLLTAFVNTLFTQTVAYAADDFGVGDWGRGVAGTVVRVGIVLSFPAAFLADRLGRRRVVIALAWSAPVIAALGALAPTFPILVATQTLGRPLGLALDLLIAVIAAEEMPRNSRAYAVSILAMANGLGAGVAVIALPLADLGDSGWRLIYVLSLVWLAVALDVTRRLPETRRFEIHARAMSDFSLDDHASTPSPTPTPTRLHRRRLIIQMSVAFFGNVLLAPASFFQNTFLKDERGFSAGMVALFTMVTATPAAIGLVIGGKVADNRGRRRLAAVCAPVGGLLIASSFLWHGPAMWFGGIAGAIVAATAYPPLAVYRTELFPTGNRGRAAYLILASALIGGSLSLLLTGALVDGGTSYGSVMLALVAGPLMVSLIVWRTYPETAHRELEDLNPEDPRV